MGAWGIAEWFGKDIVEMSPSEREAAADSALAASALSLKDAPQPLCPFQATLKPGALCNKVGGVCSIRQYQRDGDRVVATDAQPTTLCPSRFLEHRGERSIFAHIAKELYGVESGAKAIKEIPFLQKETLDGEERGAKAGRIDWIVVPFPADKDGSGWLDWVAVETQGVYFSGDKIWPDIEEYKADPYQVHMPAGKRRPDYRSSGAKRLAPQLDAKSPVMIRWGRKVVVVVDIAFFNELGALTAASDFDNSEVVWFVVRYAEDMQLSVTNVVFAELGASIAALQAAKPVQRAQFEQMLKLEIGSSRTNKVFDA